MSAHGPDAATGDERLLLEVRQLVLDYHDGSREIRAVDHVDLHLERGEFVGLVGPSGSGKSSLLFLVAGLRPPTSGSITFRGRPVPGHADRSAALRRRHIGFLFQEPFLVPYLTVRENALSHAHEPSARRRLEALAEAVGMLELLDERPHRLSGGERQRASLLRALANDPALVLADEPTASLDQATGRSVMEVLQQHTQTAGLLVVTHDPGMLKGADRILYLRDGRLVSA